MQMRVMPWSSRKASGFCKGNGRLNCCQSKVLKITQHSFPPKLLGTYCYTCILSSVLGDLRSADSNYFFRSERFALQLVLSSQVHSLTVYDLLPFSLETFKLVIEACSFLSTSIS